MFPISQVVKQKSSVISRITLPPSSTHQKDVQILILRTHEYVTLHGKSDFANVLKDREMGNHPGLSGWAQCNHKSPYKGKKEAGESISQVGETQLVIAAFEDGRRRQVKE